MRSGHQSEVSTILLVAVLCIMWNHNIKQNLYVNNVLKNHQILSFSSFGLLLSHIFLKKRIIPLDEQYKLSSPIWMTRVDIDAPPIKTTASSSSCSSVSMDDIMTELRAICSEMHEVFKELNDRMDHFERSFTPNPPNQQLFVYLLISLFCFVFFDMAKGEIDCKQLQFFFVNNVVFEIIFF